jgi:hypothetical protein
MKDLRKKYKIEIELTHKDLCNFENDWMCVPLCDKHKKVMIDKKAFLLSYDCSDCIEIRKEWHRGSGKIFWQCWNKFWEKVEE